MKKRIKIVNRLYKRGPVTQRSMPLWPVRNRLSDPFGAPVLEEISALEAVELVCQAARSGWIELTSAHDDDLVPWNPDDPEDDLDPKGPVMKTLEKIKAKLKAAGLGFHTMTCNLHSHPVFRAGGLTNPDSEIRALAREKVRRAIRIGAFLNARKFTYWVARDGFTVPTAINLKAVYGWIADGLNSAREYIIEQKYDSYEGGTIEPKPNEPTGHSHIPTAGHAVGFIMAMLDDSDFWGVNPELTQHEGMTLLNATNCVAYLLAVGKFSFLHFGNQIPGHEDNDFPPLVGPSGLKETAQMFWALEHFGWKGVVEFDCHMLRSEADPKHAYRCRLEFIKSCSAGLAIALVMSKRLRDFEVKTKGLGASESEVDLAATADMCGIPPEGVELFMQPATD